MPLKTHSLFRLPHWALLGLCASLLAMPSHAEKGNVFLRA
jgi:hypothetical protein